MDWQFFFALFLFAIAVIWGITLGKVIQRGGKQWIPIALLTVGAFLVGTGEMASLVAP